jgi:hypothetical protein
VKFYIASRLENADRVRQLRDVLISVGHEITYDWTIAGPVRDDKIAMIQVSRREVRGVLESNLFFLLLPGGRGAHVELGLAIGQDADNPRQVLVWSETPEPLNYGQETSAFYHHDAVGQLVMPFEMLLEGVTQRPMFSGFKQNARNEWMGVRR